MTIALFVDDPPIASNNEQMLQNEKILLETKSLKQSYRKRVGKALVSMIYDKAHHGWAHNIYLIKLLRWLQNVVLRLVFANSVFHKRNLLLIFEVEFTESVV